MYLQQYAVSIVTFIYRLVDVHNLFCKGQLIRTVHLLQWRNLVQTPPAKEGWYKL